MPSILSLLLIASTVSQSYSSNPIEPQEVQDQNKHFKQWWKTEFNWKFDELPTKGSAARHRVPYAGYIYPDLAGGTKTPLAKYDHAFRPGQNHAAAFERWDISAHRQQTSVRGGLFGRRSRTVSAVPHWAGHCNGWAAAAIRHAEPQKNVTRNGVVFTPADIKGLLAEVYIYSDTVFLGGLDYVIHPATFHAVVTNWVGRQSHPIGMETTPGTEVWNYPLYAFAISSTKRSSGRQVEIKMNVAYKSDTDREHHKAPENKELKYFHYLLDLDKDGKIIGGEYYGDSAHIDMLWTPLRLVQGGAKGNEQGNPHLDIKEVLAIWRESIDAERQIRWVNIDTRNTKDRPDTDVATSEETQLASRTDPAEADEENSDGSASE